MFCLAWNNHAKWKKDICSQSKQEMIRLRETISTIDRSLPFIDSSAMILQEINLRKHNAYGDFTKRPQSSWRSHVVRSHIFAFRRPNQQNEAHGWYYLRGSQVINDWSKMAAYAQTKPNSAYWQTWWPWATTSLSARSGRMIPLFWIVGPFNQADNFHICERHNIFCGNHVIQCRRTNLS